MNQLNEYFLKDLENYWHCEVRDEDTGSDLLRALNHPSHLISAQDFKRALADAIENCNIGVEEYEKITGLDFERVDDVAKDLRDLWEMMYGT